MNQLDKLSAVLRQWRVEARHSDDFAHNVWQKIEERRAHPIRWRTAAALEWLKFELPRPVAASLVVTVVAAFAFIFAQWAGSSQREASLRAASERYFASIDPISHIAAQAHRP